MVDQILLGKILGSRIPSSIVAAVQPLSGGVVQPSSFLQGLVLGLVDVDHHPVMQPLGDHPDDILPDVFEGAVELESSHFPVFCYLHSFADDCSSHKDYRCFDSWPNHFELVSFQYPASTSQLEHPLETVQKPQSLQIYTISLLRRSKINESRVRPPPHLRTLSI